MATPPSATTHHGGEQPRDGANTRADCGLKNSSEPQFTLRNYTTSTDATLQGAPWTTRDCSIRNGLQIFRSPPVCRSSVPAAPLELLVTVGNLSIKGGWPRFPPATASTTPCKAYHLCLAGRRSNDSRIPGPSHSGRGGR